MRPIAVTFCGAEVLWPEGVITSDISVADGVITPARQPREVDLSGCAVRPGMVDLHGDGFERHLAPRRGLIGDPGEGFLSLDAELAACGITTAVLAQFWSWEGGMRGPDFARALAEALDRIRPWLITDMRLQLRLETHMTADFGQVEAFVAEHGIGYVCFNDHLPHKALESDRLPPRLTGQALKGGRSPEAHLALMRRLHDRGPEVPTMLDHLAERLRASGVRLASHDDPDPATRDAMRARGVAISEFPEALPVAVAAKKAGDAVILGAPNVVRGGSHAGGMDAGPAVSDGLCDALVSDYHYPSLRTAAERIAPEFGIEAAWALVSAAPAALLGLTNRGALVPGRRADLVIIGPSGGIEATISGGRLGFARGEVGARLAS